MATQVMYRPVGERLLRLMPSLETPLIAYTILTIILLAAHCAEFMVKVEKLKGGYGLLQMLRTVSIAHIFRFLLSILGENYVPPSFYLRKVLPFHDLPITASIVSFCCSIRILRISLHIVPLTVAICLPLFILIWKTKGRELEQDISPTQAPPNFSILYILSKILPLEAKDIIDIEVIDHFAIILLTAIGVDLLVHVERLTGQHDTSCMITVLTVRHCLYFMYLLARPNNAPLLNYLGKVLPFYDIPFSLAFASFFSSSDDWNLVLILELSFLGLIHTGHISRKENLNTNQGTEPKQDIRPTQASSSNTEELPPQQNHDAANNAISSPPNLSQREICDPPNGDGGSPSVNVASNGVNRDLSAVNEESAGSAAISISKATDFSTWESRTFIGAGAFGAVFVFEDKKTGRSCAVKQLKDNYEREKREPIRKEIDIFSNLEHPNIVKYYLHQEIDGRISICMEYIKRGSLKKYISNREKEKEEGKKILEEGVLDEPQIKKFTAQILSGLVYLHGRKVVHRDLKPDNILVDDDDILKLVDFGLAKKLAESMGKHSVLGTPYYAAPEVLQNMEYERSHDASAADIWSLGCVIFEMFSGEHPWSGFEPQQAFFKVCFEKRHPPIPEGLCSEGKDFLKLCFARIPAERPSAAELLRHAFVKAKTC